MATNYNITMKRYNGTDYDVLYPRTLPSQIDGGVYTKDEATGLFLSKTGGQMSGLLDMNGNKISNLAAPTAANDAATKDYVDNNSYISVKASAEVSYSPSTGSVLHSFNTYQATGIAGLHIYGTATLKSGISTPSRQIVYLNFDNATYTTLIQLFVGNGNTDDGKSAVINQFVWFLSYFTSSTINDSTVDLPGYYFYNNGSLDKLLAKDPDDICGFHISFENSKQYLDSISLTIDLLK